MATIIVPAYAKINLGLEILGKRTDGYHDLVTILQTIDLADQLTCVEAVEVTLESNDPALAEDPKNLVLRAALLLREAAGVERGASIRLEKNIPIAAGLGGGSSDAAATLRALNRLWGLGMNASELIALAGQLGADVSFFLRGGTQLATGLGDELEPLPTLAGFVVVVALPSPYPDKTRRLYGALRSGDWSDGEAVRALAESLREGRPIFGQSLPSGFARVTRELFPDVDGVFAAIQRAGGTPSLCGAGPTVISLLADREKARRITADLRAAGFQASFHRTVGSL